MERVAAIAQALSDPGRIRLLAGLRDGERCVCQLIDVIGLAPSTVSKHLSILHDVGLVLRRKKGRWAYYRLAGRDAPPAVRRAIRWVCDSVADDPAIADDARRFEAQSCRDLGDLATCYRN